MRLLHLAASTSEVEAALTLLREQGLPPTFDAVRELVRPATAVGVPALTPAVLDLGVDDQLLAARGDHA